ncbi:winged helix-turn-helix domain-containing protein [Halopenitus persicus]|uniref:winged helix-turn-helix domain-containing protein n=1 Tax=Halopenitus persicus TaxID=1048396 RepID=UPI000BBA6DAF|nr:winged helix-turn-helix domain-containing protein [Halopenitus persicus]
MTATQTDIHLSPTDEAILDEIDAHGRATTTLIARVIDKNEQHVRDRVKRLVEHGVLMTVAPHLYDRPEAARDYLPADEFDD